MLHSSPSRRVLVLLAALALALSATVTGAQVPMADTGGVAPDGPQAEFAVDVGVVRPQRVFANALAISAGVGLRNRASGAIDLSGLPASATVIHARIYWNVISNGPLPPGGNRIHIRRVGPAGAASSNPTGTIVGTGRSPCWGGDRNTVFRATVPIRVVNGNATYLITPPAGIPGRVDGASPWYGGPTVSSLPMFNGASLVVVYRHPGGNVMVYDAPLSGTMFIQSLSAALYIPPPSRFGSLTFLHMINSDGQAVNSGFLDTLAATERTLVNNVLISGVGSIATDGDWNGAQGGRFAQLWDNAVRNVSFAVPAAAPRARIQVESGADCLVPVAAILSRN